MFCGMGVCSECAVQVEGETGRLACMESLTLAWGSSATRRLAGSTRPLRRQPPRRATERKADSDVLVVGAGPAGLRAAVAAAGAGARVLVVDERRGRRAIPQATRRILRR